MAKGKLIGVFYAYPAEPPAVVESINTALRELKESSSVRERNVRFRPWTSMSGGGKPVMRVVAKSIEDATMFACDLTYPNFNVTFELGYAIGKFKRIWLSLNTVVDSAPKDYKRIYSGLLGGLMYEPYTNHKELVSAFVNRPPWADLEATPLGKPYRDKAARQERPTLLHVKPPLDTDAVITTGEDLQSSVFRDAIITDDPRENPSPALEWYAEKIRIADAVLLHLLADTHQESRIHNFKCSFVAGLAYGLDKPLLLVAHSPLDVPADYQPLLRVHDTARQCSGLVKNWIASLDLGLPRRRPRRPEEPIDTTQTLDLRKLSIGEPVAENEQRTLDGYFVETSSYYHALEGPTTIFVGRRGTGKTANLFALRRKLSEDRLNHVCVVKPVGYEIDGLVRVLNENLHRSERGYLVASLWKFLIFSELACSVFDEISTWPAHVVQNSDEHNFMVYVTNKRDALFLPLSERLDRAVKSLVGVGNLTEAAQQRIRISELLHLGELQELRKLLGLVLNKRRKVAILIDNLDEPWSPGQHIESLSELLRGLLRVVEDVSDEFQHQDYWRRRVDVSVTVFLRSDIFAFIHPLAPEQDKLPIQRIVWDNPELLLKVLNQRIEHAVPAKFDVQTIWQQLFPAEVVGVPTAEFILRTVLPRPRDVIFLVRSALDGAVNRGHQVVSAEDFLDARNKYSEFAFRSILAEDDPSKRKMEAVLYEFAGAPKVVKLSDVHSRITRAGARESEVEFYIDLLCDVGFLGIQTATHGFQYAHHEGERQMMRQVARRLAIDRAWGEESFEIKAAFHQVLQIE